MPRKKQTEIEIIYEDPPGLDEPSKPEKQLPVSSGLDESSKKRLSVSRTSALSSSDIRGLEIGDRFVSEGGHEVFVVGTGENETIFGFTRMVRGEPEKRTRVVPHSELHLFLRAYTRH